MMFVKMEMFSGRIVTGQTLNSKEEADHENKILIESKSTYRWVGSLRELGEFERELKDGDRKR